MTDLCSKRKCISVVTKTGKLVFCTSFVRQFYLRNWIRYQTLKPTGNIPDTPVAWKQPEKLPFNHPWKTGDFVQKNERIDTSGHPAVVMNSSELAKASEPVKRIFSFDFLGRKYAQLQIRDNMIASVRNHRYDKESLEVKVAACTAIARNLNEHLETQPYHRPCRNYLNAVIYCRHNTLTELRECDYKRFEWLLEKLNITYQPRQEEYLVPRRDQSIRDLTDKYVEDYKERKLASYRTYLDSQKEEFLKEKVASLIWMRKEEIECGVETPSVTKEIIEAAEKQLEEHQEMLRNRVIVEDTSVNILKET